MAYSILIKISARGRGPSVSKGALHGISYGTSVITPRNFSIMLSQMKNESAGAMVGRRQHKPIVITKEWGAASPQLLNAHWTNEALSSVVLEIVGRPSSGSGETVVSRITLTNAQISKINRFVPRLTGGPRGSSEQKDTNELEEVEFTYQKIEFNNLAGSTSAGDDWKTG